MKFPFNAVSKFIYPLFSYFFKGAKIDASLEFYKGGGIFNDPNRNSFKLTLQNNSNFSAYQIKILNAEDIFYSIEKMVPLTSLQPHFSTITFCRFEKYYDPIIGENSAYKIPENKIGKFLVISYVNEGRRKFYTKFTIDDNENKSEYSYRNPLK